MKTAVASHVSYDPAAAQRPPDALRILCLLPTLTPYGGVISVVNVLNIFVDRGHRVTLLSFSRTKHDVLHPKTEPVYAADRETLPEGMADGHDVFLATSWETVDPIARLAALNPAATAFYFVQDFEPDFHPAEDQQGRAAAMATYDLIPNRIVKTRHLQEKLAAHGWEAHRISPGMDLDTFYPRAAAPSTRDPSVIAMARHTANDHRGLSILQDVYRGIAARRPDVQLRVFGHDDLPGGFSSDVENLGRVAPSDLPEAYSRAAVFLDTSRFHGFGRTGVEAMACGATCVLSDSGGISEYARHGENAVIVPVADVEATVTGVVDLFEDPIRMDRLASAGRSTVSDYSDYGAASEMELLFRAARPHAHRFAHSAFGDR